MRKLAFVLGLFFLASVTGFGQINPQTVFPFPQIAVGQNADFATEFRTQIILTNPSDREAQGLMDFLDDNGRDITLNVRSLRTGQQVEATGFIRFSIQPGVTTIWELSSPNVLKTGSSIVSTNRVDGGNDVRISGTAAYGIYDRRGRILSLAAVGASGFITDAMVPIVADASQFTNTGIAFTTLQTANMTFTLLDDNGRVIDRAAQNYGPGIHRAMFYNDIFNRPLPSQLTIQSLRVTSTTQIAVIAVEVTGDNNVLTTYPVVALAGSSYSANALEELGGLIRQRHPNLDLNGPVLQ